MLFVRFHNILKEISNIKLVKIQTSLHIYHGHQYSLAYFFFVKLSFNKIYSLAFKI